MDHLTETKPISVTIGIPAYNESKNISNLVKAVFMQKTRSCRIERVIVLCDGCTDETINIVTNLMKNYERLSIVKGQRRLGKAERLRQLFIKNESELVISFDGDILPANDMVIEEMVREFKNSRVVFVCGNKRPATPENIFERLVNLWEDIWYAARKDVSGGDNIYNVCGCAMALRRSFAKKVRFIKGVAAEQAGFYLLTVKMGLVYHFAPKAIVYFRSPNNAHDYFLRTKRSSNPRKVLARYFGEWVYKEFPKIPLSNKIRAVAPYIISDPVTLTLAMLLQVRVALLPEREKLFEKKGYWTPVASTKRAITGLSG